MAHPCLADWLGEVCYNRHGGERFDGLLLPKRVVFVSRDGEGTLNSEGTSPHFTP